MSVRNQIWIKRLESSDSADWECILQIATSHDSFVELVIYGPSQNIVLELAKSMMKPAIYGHKK